MKQDQGRLKAQFFVCTNVRADGKSCGAQGSKELREQLKAELKTAPECKGLRVSSSGCLGRCEEGPVAVLYPEGLWFTDVQPADKLSLMEILKKRMSET